MLKNFLLAAIFATITLQGFSQSELVKITIHVVNKENGIGISNAVVASYTDVEIYATDDNGICHLDVAYTDSFRIAAMGYDLERFKIPAHTKDFSDFTVTMKPRPFMLKEVTIQKINLHLPKDIKLGEGKGVDLGENSRPYNPGLASSSTFLNPIYTVKSLTSRSMRARRKLYDNMIENQGSNERARRFLTKEIIQDICGLKGDELNQFIIYCNVNVKVEKSDNETSVRHKILRAFTLYKN